MANDPPDGSNDLTTEVIFVRRGDPPPLEWMERHPGWVKFPATMIPRNSPDHPDNRAAGTSAAASSTSNIAQARAPETVAFPPGTLMGGRNGSDVPLHPSPSAGPAIDPIAAYRRSNDAIASYLTANAALGAVGPNDSSGKMTRRHVVDADGGVDSRPGAKSPETSKTVNTTKPDDPVIFIGGFGDRTSGNVSGYYERFLTGNPDVAAKYFSFDDKGAIIAYINSLKPGTPVTIVGHSWGGDTAMEVVNALPKGRVQTLVTIDTVGSGGDTFMNTVAKHTNRWIDVDAVGGGWRDLSNFVARDLAALYGGATYGTKPSQYATSFLKSSHAHREFAKMMAEIDPATGQRIEDIVASKTK